MRNDSYDTIIIGAGSVGTPLAWQLAEAGQKVLVIDRFASVGQGSNKHAIGGIRATHSDPAKIKISQKSLEIFSAWERERGDDIEWKRGGYSFVAYHLREERFLKDLLVAQKRLGLDIDWRDARSLIGLIPSLNPKGLIGGTFSPGDGSASPMLSALAFERRAKALGARFRYRETATAIDIENGRVRGVRTDRGSYGAAMVVNAAGPWARQVAAMAGIDVPVWPDSHEGGITEPVAPFLGPMVVDIHPTETSSNYYFYQSRTGQVIFCITPNPPLAGTDIRETSSFLPEAARRMIGVMPRLRNIKVRRTWRGLYPMTPDGAPIVGEAEGLSGYLDAVGMCGQGFMLGPGLAVYLRMLITGDGAAEARSVLAPLGHGRDFGKRERLG